MDAGAEGVAMDADAVWDWVMVELPEWEFVGVAVGLPPPGLVGEALCEALEVAWVVVELAEGLLAGEAVAEGV